MREREEREARRVTRKRKRSGESFKMHTPLAKVRHNFGSYPHTMKSLRNTSAFASVLARMARLKTWSSGANIHCRSSGEIGWKEGRSDSLLQGGEGGRREGVRKKKRRKREEEWECYNVSFVNP